VPFLLQPEAQDLLRKNKTLWISFAPVGGKDVRVEMPLDGFGAALAAIK
jgi:invasion protein IalB